MFECTKPVSLKIKKNVWKNLTSMQQALTSTPFSVFRMNCNKPGLRTQRQCWISNTVLLEWSKNRWKQKKLYPCWCFLWVSPLELDHEMLHMHTYKEHVRFDLINESFADMMACYGGISVISPWLASLAVFMSVYPSSLTSTTSLVCSQARWLICVCVNVLCVRTPKCC